MRGTLHKTENGWQVWYHAKEDLFYGNTGVRILPLHSDDAAGLFIQDTDSTHDGTEVEFEIFDNRQICNCACHRNADITHFVACCNDGYKTDNIGHVNYYAKLVDKATRPLTENDAWITMKEGDITINFKPMPEFDEPIGLLNSIRANRSWDTIFTEFHIATQQVEIGRQPLIFECWLVDNYNPPNKKQDL
jgi:hypothetical protein